MDEINEFETKPRGTFWRDWGVYCALALCLAVIGAAVAITSLPQKEQAQEPAQNIVVRDPEPEPDPLPVSNPLHARETELPVIRILPTATAEPAANDAAKDSPVPGGA